MSSSNPRFSVLIPVYNVEKYLAECIDSVLNQTYDNYEIILANDGSTDSSLEICRRYEAENDKITVYSKKNEGLFKTRYFLLTKAKGDYTVFLDSDDWLEREALSILNDSVNDDNPDCIIYRIKEHKNGQVVVWESEKDSKEKLVLKDKSRVAQMVLFDQSYNSMCIKAVRRGLIGKAEMNNMGHVVHGEDLVRTLEVLKNCTTFVFLPNALYNYRRNDASITRSITASNFKIDFTVEKAVIDFAIKENIFGETQEKDLEKLRYRNISSIAYSIIFQIAKLDATNKEKKKLFKELENNEFFNKYINTGKPVDYSDFEKGHERYYKLFIEKRYNTLIFLGNLSRLKAKLGH